MVPAFALGLSTTGWGGLSRAGDKGGICAVRLIDRRTGAAHRINGTPLVVFTRRPDEAVADLLSGRDASVWEARVEEIGPKAGREAVQ
jgi:hypothetical protein